MNILGISCYYHESAAALIRDGRVIAAGTEERFTRKKHDDSFPTHAIAMCLRTGGIRAEDLDHVVFYEKPFVKFSRNILMSMEFAPRSREYFVESMQNAFARNLWIKSKIAELGVAPEKILFVPQHLSHAAASFYTSPFRRAAVLTLDGVGEWTTGTVGVAENNKISIQKELRYPDSVGLLYSAFTAYLGFEVNDGEYKVMGMAGYGKPEYLNRVKKLYKQKPDGSIVLNLDYFSFPYSTKRMYTKEFITLFNGCDKFAVAASIQKATEEIILTMARVLYNRTHVQNLVYGGGVALNSVVNGLLAKKTPFKRVFIFPAAGDDGAAVGAALYVYHHVLGHTERYPLADVFLGSSYPAKTMQDFLVQGHIPYKKMRDEKLFPYIADKLVKGSVVGWFEGRSEFGPRALGHRSIFADPKNPNMKHIVNEKIKFREEFRPFAPMVLSRFAKKYFPKSDTLLSPFMLAAWQASEAAKKIAAATVHVDGTSRIQTVDHPLLRAFYKKTRRPILLNTSFNVKGEPIVETPEDAYRTFVKSGLDMLVLGNFVISKHLLSKNSQR